MPGTRLAPAGNHPINGARRRSRKAALSHPTQIRAYPLLLGFAALLALALPVAPVATTAPCAFEHSKRPGASSTNGLPLVVGAWRCGGGGGGWAAINQTHETK